MIQNIAFQPSNDWQRVVITNSDYGCSCDLQKSVSCNLRGFCYVSNLRELKIKKSSGARVGRQKLSLNPLPLFVAVLGLSLCSYLNAVKGVQWLI
jgi:hypothetical protein